MCHARWFSPCRLPSSLAMGKRVLHHEIISMATGSVQCVRQRSSGSVELPQQVAQESEVVRQFLRPGKLFGGSIQINKKLPNQNPDFRILTHESCPSMVFNDSLWNLIGFKLSCPWQKISPRPCLKSCISSRNLRAQRAIRFVEHKQRFSFLKYQST